MQAYNISKFKEQTLKLLRDQTCKLKNSLKQISVKDEQMKFLKETIKSLEQERDQLLNSNQQLRMKMKNMLSEVSAYNTNVIKKIYEQNNTLVEQINFLKKDMEDQIIKNEENKSKQNQLQNRQNIILNEITQLKSNEKLFKEEVKQTKTRKDNLQEQNRKLKTIQIQLSSKNQSLKNKLYSMQQQIDMLTNKYQQNINCTQQKYYQILKKKVDRDEYHKLEQKIKNQQFKYEKLNQQKNKINRQYEELKLQCNKLKQSLINSQLKYKMTLSRLQTDIKNFSQCFKFNKKIQQFQSLFSSHFYFVYEIYQQKNQIYEEQSNQLESLKEQLNYLTNKLSACKQELQLKQTQINIHNRKHNQQIQCLQGSYESKLLQLALKVKNEQYQLTQLKGISKQSQQLQKQYDKLFKDHMNLKETSNHTINQLDQQNNRLIQQIQQVVEMCQDNIYNKNTINGIRHIINQLLVVIYYLHLMMIRNREKNRKIFAPFIQYYQQVHNKIIPKKENSKLRKFRSSVWVIVSIIRMKTHHKTPNHKKGLMYHIERAVVTRDKISNMSTHLENLYETVIKTTDNSLQTLLALSKSIYQWNYVKNYCKINLHINDDIALLSSSQKI